MIHRFPGGAWTVWIGFGLSLAIHLTLISFILLRNPQRPGVIELATEAISVNLETTDILDSVQQSPAAEAASATATPADEVSEPQAKAEQQDMPPETVSEAEQDVAAEHFDPVPEKPEADIERQRIAEEALRRAERQRGVEERKRAQREKRKAARASSSASGSRGAEASAGRISASRGAVQNYAAIVRERIARNKPSGGRTSGRVIVSFALSPSGGLISARVVASSGNGSLDQDALLAIHRASPFPAPPEGATAGQLHFTIPFQFR